MSQENVDSNVSGKNGTNNSAKRLRKVPRNNCLGGVMGKIIKYLLFGFGGVFLILGFAITGFWKPLFRYLIANNLALTNDSQTKELWVKGEVPIYFKVYLFNWTNPVQTLAHQEKANFQENGPYTFKFAQLKSDIVWNSNHTVTYKARRDWEFIPEKSNGSLSDIITNINVVAVAVGDKIKDLSKFDKFVVNGIISLNEKSVFISKTAEELLFKGYDDKLLDLGIKLKKYIKNLNFPSNKFAWYLGKNESQVDVYNINTGTDDINRLGVVRAWNYKSRLNVYNGRCDEAHGSLGDLWPMNIADQSKASIFISDLCGAFDLSNKGRKDVYDVEGTQFVGDERTFDNGKNYPENSCYCANSRCDLPSGVRDVSACQQAPIYISFPHFYKADPSYTSNLKGISPDPDKHQFAFTLQTDSGILMEIFARLQINMKVGAYPGLSFYSDLPNMMVPTLWFEQYIEMPENLKEQMRLTFNVVPKYVSAGGIILVILGAVLLLCGFIIARLSYVSVPYTRDDI